MQQLPLVRAEVQRVRAAFSGAADELAAVLERLAHLDLGTVGTPSGDAVVEAGLADLRTGLSWFASTSEQCVVALARHLPDEPPTAATEAVPPGTGASDEAGEGTNAG